MNQGPGNQAARATRTDAAVSAPSVQSAQLPKAESELIAAVEKYASQYQAAPNQLKASALRAKRRETIRDAVTSRRAKKWLGTLKGMGTRSNGYATFSVQLPNSQVAVQNFGLSDDFLIKPGTRLYKAASDLHEGDLVSFSGDFVGPGDQDFLGEGSLSEAGAMTEPEFFFKFTSIEKAAAH